jgi:hypothetical protein
VPLKGKLPFAEKQNVLNKKMLKDILPNSIELPFAEKQNVDVFMLPAR